jgi:thioredoxin-dependent peroxiredoxin
MVDPPKATKGRRMSKKTRNKSPKKSSRPSPRKAPRAQSATPAISPASKPRRATANKSGNNKNNQTAHATSAASHRAPSKQLNKAGPPAPGKSALAEGAKAPAFRLPRDGGSTVSLSDYSGRKLVLFFYPRGDTPGCTREAIDFTRLAAAFDQSQTAVLGVSADPLRAQESFRDKHQLSIPLVSDERHQTLEAYGAWGEKSMYGKTFQGVLRTTVLVGEDSRIIKIWRNVRVEGHAEEVLAAARTA